MIVLSDGGRETCRPPTRLKRRVKEPKSVWAPRAVRESAACCGGALRNRTWSPEGERRRCRDGRVPLGRCRCVFRWVRMRARMECAVEMKEVKRGRLWVRMVGAGRGEERERMSSLEIYVM